MDAIARAYIRRIERGAITVEDVPASIRGRVEELMGGKDEGR